MREGEEEGGRGETLTTWQVIGTEDEAADVGIPVFGISLYYQSIPVPDWFPLFRFQVRASP
jgi:hypothetical protein